LTYGEEEGDYDSYPAFASVQSPAPFWRTTALVDGDFKTISSEDYKGKWLVLFFYPLDFTFV
jgi:alkyl hydroperoxide reductase subunit AhpC